MHDCGLIQLAFGWIGQDWSNSPNGELDWVEVRPTHPTASWIGRSNSPLGELVSAYPTFRWWVGRCWIGCFDAWDLFVRWVEWSLARSWSFNSLLKIRSFSVPYSYFLFRKVSRGLSCLKCFWAWRCFTILQGFSLNPSLEKHFGLFTHVRSQHCCSCLDVKEFYLW